MTWEVSSLQLMCEVEIISYALCPEPLWLLILESAQNSLAISHATSLAFEWTQSKDLGSNPACRSHVRERKGRAASTMSFQVRFLLLWKIPWPKATCGGKGWFIFNFRVILYHHGKSGQEIKARTWRQEVMQKSWRNAAYRFAHHSLLSLLS